MSEDGDEYGPRVSVRMPPSQLTVLDYAAGEDFISTRSAGLQKAVASLLADVHPEWLDDETAFEPELPDYRGPFEKVTFRLSRGERDALDDAVDAGAVPNRSEAIRIAVKRYLDHHQDWREAADDPNPPGRHKQTAYASPAGGLER